MERSRSERHWFLWRPNLDEKESEDDCEDPDRVVFAADVTPLLFRVDKSQHFNLVCRCLQVLGVSFAHEPRLTVDDLKGASDSNIPTILNEVLSESLSCNVTEEFVLNCLEQCSRRLAEDEATLLLHVSVEHQMKVAAKQNSHRRLKGLKKWMKALLKEERNRNNLTLWCDLARVDAALGDHSAAANVLVTTASLCTCDWLNKAVATLSQRDVEVMRLASTFAELHMQESVTSVDAVACRKFLTSFALGEAVNRENLQSAPTPTQQLKARNVFEKLLTLLLQDFQNCDKQRDSQSCTRVAYFGNALSQWVHCYAYFLFVSYGIDAVERLYVPLLSSIESITPVLDKNLQTYRLKTEEKLWLQYVELCNVYTRSKPVSVKVAREPLLRALHRLPDSPLLLRLFVEWQCKAGLARQLRSFFFKTLKDNPDRNLFIFAVYAELLRHKFITLSNPGRNC